MKLIKKSEIIIKKSKFIGYYYEIDSKMDAENILKELKKEHKKARHIPYAYKLDVIAKKSDDKEPSNTAGAPILNIIELKKNEQLSNCCCSLFWWNKTRCWRFT